MKVYHVFFYVQPILTIFTTAILFKLEWVYRHEGGYDISPDMPDDRLKPRTLKQTTYAELPTLVLAFQYFPSKNHYFSVFWRGLSVTQSLMQKCIVCTHNEGIC